MCQKCVTAFMDGPLYSKHIMRKKTVCCVLKFHHHSFKNDRVIAIWKFLLWINLAYIWWKLLESDPKSEFSNGYKSVIFKEKIYDKISKHWELPREFKNAKIFKKKFWEDFLKNTWKSAIFKKYLFNY